MAQAARLANVTLDDKYTETSGRVYLNGMQALTRLTLMQRQRDVAAGLSTAGYVTGYRGSPLGGLDQAMVAAKKHLEQHHIKFQPGVNEDLAATALWGTQQLDLFGDSKYDGVFGMWYGKGPGVDRCGDVFRHANLAGTAKHGGVLVLAGDDHTCKSSTTAHQTEYAFMDYGIPVLNPANIQEFLDYGIFGWAASRYSGCWIAMKVVADNCDSTASVYVDPDRVQIKIPDDFELPTGGLNIRKASSPFITTQALEQEMLLHKYKLYAALAFCRANHLNKVMIDSPNRRFGIVTCGKTYMDVRQALDDLGIDEDYAKRIGLSLYKVGMTWPLEREGVRHFAEGLEEILVVEEKRALMENQLKEQLYNWKESVRPKVVGKFDENREWILPSADELTPARIARVIARRIARFHTSPQIEDRLKFLEAKEKALEGYKPAIRRVAYFCSGCPHNTSTNLPEGSRALGGIGCHTMATWMDRGTETLTQMGGEGVTWVGQAPFSKTKHVFQNLGDGTYYHSGLIAIRAAVASGANITYKILFNDAVAMTGGQPFDGPLTVPMMAQQLAAEGLRKITIVSDEPEKYAGVALPGGIIVHHRDELDAVQRELREIPGTTAMIYDQTCAAEKRRRRKRGLLEDPALRVFINEEVCEGCGDCSKASNCLSVIPLETATGRKRAIDQSSCNKDYSCLNGFCPSFVTIEGGQLRKPKPVAAIGEALPEPTLPALQDPFNILVTGIGGTGVVTIGALLGMAAHLEGKGCSIMDMTGLAQKGGAVFSHIRIANRPEDIHAVRVAAGNADLLLGCDEVVAATFDALAKGRVGHSRAIINSHETITADFIKNPDAQFPGHTLQAAIEAAVGPGAAEFVDGTGLATALIGDTIASNMFMLGFAYQRGLIPVSAEAILKAIELNATAAKQNQLAFTWGRRAAHDLPAVTRAAEKTSPTARRIPQSLDEIIAHRETLLTSYQNAAYAARYRKLVDRVIAAERAVMPNLNALSVAVATYYAKLLAYKDEYEVARLHADPVFQERIAAQFEGDYKIHFHLAPPSLSHIDPETGRIAKKQLGPWMMRVFRLLARLKGLRGGALDPFSRLPERRLERRLIADYEALIEEIITLLDAGNHATAVALASIPEQIRGYGHVKEAHLATAKKREAELLTILRSPPD
ncbi:MAG TPA: indolepyruvate ferredoxin oxidoreductase family protein, partial [Dongiaceae bacterium]|nr:indolepyruvate ferredoxin oxidoreductase family protein [Dongiaceae bacterium]